MDDSRKLFKQMIFIHNALEEGWIIKKKNDCYIFSQKHNNKKEVYNSDYLEKFLERNSVINSMYEKMYNSIK